MFPVAFLSGILFPFIAARIQANVEDPMNCAGLTTLFNTSGAAAGPLLASFVLLPGIGFQWTLILCAGSYALLAVMAGERSSWSLRRPLGATMLGLCLTLIVIARTFPYHRDEAHFANARRPYEVDQSHSDQKDRGNIRYVAAVGVRSFRRTLLLSAGDERLLDVQHASAQPALYEIVRVPSAGF